MKRDIKNGVDPSALWTPVYAPRRVKNWDQP
jgi:hypothetical protein